MLLQLALAAILGRGVFGEVFAPYLEGEFRLESLSGGTMAAAGPLLVEAMV